MRYWCGQCCNTVAEVYNRRPAVRSLRWRYVMTLHTLAGSFPGYTRRNRPR